jgi:alkaline phosphatase D
MSTVTRRSFLGMAAAIGATAGWGNPFATKSRIAWRERRDLFPEGVASGDPDSNSVLLWTRRPPAGENLAPKLNVEVSEDERSLVLWRQPRLRFPEHPTGPAVCWSAG